MVIIMTKQEIIEFIGEKAAGLSEDELKELASFTEYLEWRREMDSLRDQYEESLKDIKRGDLYTLDEIEQGLDLQ